MKTINFEPTKRQATAYKLLTDNKTKEIGYGGAAGGGKSFLGCFWLFTECLAYPGIACLIGRKELTNLKKTTYATFFKVIAHLGLNPEQYFTVDGQNNIIKFHNGSRIYLYDMAYKPSDPEYLRLGGLEIIYAFLDESNEIDEKAISILKTRMGRSGEEYGLIPKLLETFNPSKNHVYTRYYQPWRENNLPDYRVFIIALATDNQHLTSDYIKQLENSDEVTKQRLLYGNFDYDDDDRALCSFDKIQDVFTNTFVKGGKKYLVSDLAMKGRDKFVVTSWDGLRCSFDVIKDYSEAREIEEDLKREAEKNSVPRSQVLADSDGLGSYLESYMKGIKEFHGGAKAKNTEVFRNMKGECAFKLAELINKGEIFIDVPEDKEIKIKGKYRKLRQIIMEELGQLKRDNLDRDEAKKFLISKDEMKANIGRSPDFLDCLIMRMYFEVHKVSFRAVAG